MTRRIDATLNDERIVAAARRVLSENPAAGMDELAHAAGVGRATLYRRFSTREELLTELRAEARREALHAVKAARISEGSATDALERLIRELLGVADRFAFVTMQPDKRNPDPKLVKPWIELIKRGQAAGEFTTEVSPEWSLAVIRAHFREAAALVVAGKPLEELAALTTRAILGGLGA